MRSSLRLVTVVGLVLLLTAPVFAQGRLFYRDDAGKFDAAQVRLAAQPLVDRGAQIAIYSANNGDASTFRQYLTSDNLARSDGSVPNDLIAIFVGFGQSYSAIRYGNNYAAALGANNRYEQIRTNDLNAGLRDGKPTQGIIDALESINTAIGATAANSGSSGDVVTPNTSTDSSGSLWPWLLGGGAVVGGGALLYGATRRGQGGKQAAASARQQFEQSRKQAGAAIADALPIFQDAKDKAQYDAVSYTPADLEIITDQQRQADATYRSAQERYAVVEEAFKGKEAATSEEYSQAQEAYAQVVELVAQARSQLEPANARRSEVDKINAAAPAAIAQAKQAVQSVVATATNLGEFDRPQAITREVDGLVAEADRLLQARQGGEAATVAQQAVTSASALNELVARFGSIREGISQGRAATEQVATQGYRVDAGIQAFAKAENLLRQAAVALQSEGSAAATTLLDDAQASLNEGIGRGGGMPELQRENEARFTRIEQEGAKLPGYIEQGRIAFDAVDEYAESTWTDIRGNGSEAQAGATRAKALWERARTRNTQEAQDFYGAKLDLDDAQQEIDRSRTLIETILQRYKDLQAAQAAARRELDMAQADIAKGWQYVRSNDADVGSTPEDALHQAEELLRQATAEAAQPKPDWLALIKHAQEANRLADEALATAQGEQETMEKLRRQLAHARQVGGSEVQRLTQFAQVHPNDFTPQTAGRIQQLQQQAEQAENTAANAERAAETARTQALRTALDQYTALAEQAGQVYQQAYREFQAVDKIRNQVTAEAQRATLAIQQAERSLQMYSAYIPRDSEGIQLLERAHALINGVGTVQNDDDAKQAVANVQEAERNAQSADQLFRSYANTPISGGQSGGGDFLGGLVVGSLLGGGGGRHHGGGSGWGGSWGGGSSGGGGGGGGGGWGAGGGGGGDWGGGGGGGGGGW